MFQSKMNLKSKERLMRYAKKRDANEKELTKFMRSMGADVLDCGNIGEGHPDKIVKYRKKTYYAEIKNPSTAYGKRGLSASQIKWMNDTGNFIHVLRTENDVKEMLK